MNCEGREIRFLGDLQRLQFRPDEVLVLTMEQRCSSQQVERIRATVRAVLGDVRVLVLDGGVKLGVVAPHPDASRSA